MSQHIFPHRFVSYIILISGLIPSTSRDLNEGMNEIWDRQILRPDGVAFYRAKDTIFTINDKERYAVSFLTLSLELHDNVELSESIIKSMQNILRETKHLEENFQKESRNFEVVLGLPKSNKVNGRYPIIYAYIFNVETETLSWPGRGVDIWSDVRIGDGSFRADRLVDIGASETLFIELACHYGVTEYYKENTFERQMWMHRRTFPLGKLLRARYRNSQKKIAVQISS